MIARLHLLLLGTPAATPELVQSYADFINHRVYPRVPGRGSVGQADITVLSHVGLAFMGQGQVTVGDDDTPRKAADVLAQLKIKPLVPWAKVGLLNSCCIPHIEVLQDTLCTISSNSYAAVKAAFAISECSHLLRKRSRLKCGTDLTVSCMNRHC